MKDFEKKDIDFIRDQVSYVRAIKNKIRDTGEATLTVDDVDTLDKVSQTLTSFKFFLISDRQKKVLCDT